MTGAFRTMAMRDAPLRPDVKRWPDRGVQAAIRPGPGQRNHAARMVAAQQGGQRTRRADLLARDRGDDVPGEQPGLLEVP